MGTRRRQLAKPKLRTRSADDSLNAARMWNQENAIKVRWGDIKIRSKTKTLTDEENKLLNRLSGPPGEFIESLSGTNEYTLKGEKHVHFSL